MSDQNDTITITNDEFSPSECDDIGDKKQKYKAYKKLYYLKNKEKICEKTRRWTKENKDRKEAYLKRHFEENKEHYKEYRKQYWVKNKTKRQEYYKQWREKNKEYVRAKNSEWRNSHVKERKIILRKHQLKRFYGLTLEDFDIMV